LAYENCREYPKVKTNSQKNDTKKAMGPRSAVNLRNADKRKEKVEVRP